MPGKLGIIPNMGDTTAATRVLLGQVAGARRAPAKRRAKATTKRTTRKATRRKPSRARTNSTRRTAKRPKKAPARLVKGSAAAKRHMAKLRRMRKR